MTLMEKVLETAEGRAGKVLVVLILATSLQKVAGKVLNLISEIFLKTFSAGNKEAELSQKESADIAVDLSISFEDSIFGTERKILLSKVSYCQVCKGNGAEPGSEMEKMLHLPRRGKNSRV